jgi:hypothetical protein
MYQKIVSKYSLAVVDVDVVVVADHPTPPPPPRNVLYCTSESQSEGIDDNDDNET